MKKLLLIEDEEVLAEVILDNLEAEGYDALWAQDGRQGLALWQEHTPDLVLLDVMLPHIDGFEVCRRMREAGARTPVLFMSAKGQPEDRVKGLAMGGDDYLTKPFHLPELLLRIHNMLRRQAWSHQHQADHIVHVGPHQADLHTGEVLLADERIAHLHDDEMRLLKLFALHPGELLERDTILDEIWGDDAFPSSRAIERLVQRLRSVFEDDPHHPRYFPRLAGVRFRFEPNPPTTS